DGDPQPPIAAPPPHGNRRVTADRPSPPAPGPTHPPRRPVPVETAGEGRRAPASHGALAASAGPGGLRAATGLLHRPTLRHEADIHHEMPTNYRKFSY